MEIKCNEYNLESIPDSGLPDSGKRLEFNTGMIRENDFGRGQYVLISPIVMRRLLDCGIYGHYYDIPSIAIKDFAIQLEKGVAKYEARNWEKGGPFSRNINSALRHLWQIKDGLKDEDHISAAVFNLTCIIHNTEMIRRGLLPKTLMDLPSYLPRPQSYKYRSIDNRSITGMDIWAKIMSLVIAYLEGHHFSNCLEKAVCYLLNLKATLKELMEE